MTIAFVLGNGQSRKSVHLESLRAHGKIYGCNALYRDFVPDVLVAADPAISQQIQSSGYSLAHRFYTRKPIANSGALRIPESYWGFSSGQIALSLACTDQHNPVYLLGFDLGSTNDRFNNVYADTEFYKSSTARPTYSGNWIRQTIKIAQDFPRTRIVRVIDSISAHATELEPILNISCVSMNQFLQEFG